MLYFQVQGNGRLRALAGQRYFTKGQLRNVSTRYYLNPGGTFRVSKRVPGDIWAMSEGDLYSVPPFAGRLYETRNHWSLFRVARLKRLYTPKEIKRKAHEKSHH